MSGFYARLVATQRSNPRCRLLDWMRPEEVENWTQGIIRNAWFGEWQQEGRAEQFFLVPDPGGRVEDLLKHLDPYDRFEQERGEHAHVILVCTSWHRADHVAITQRDNSQHDHVLANARKPLHNRYRVLGPEADQLASLTPEDGACRFAAGSRRWLFERDTAEEE